MTKPTTDKINDHLASERVTTTDSTYGLACKEGEGLATTYIERLLREPGMVGSPEAILVMRNIMGVPRDPRVSGLLVGFLAAVEIRLYDGLRARRTLVCGRAISQRTPGGQQQCVAT